MRPILGLLLALALPGLAQAADLVVTVRTPDGKPAADAVITLPSPSPGALKVAGPYRMAQHNLQFEPFVLIAPVGAQIAFPNLDYVRHHVYSFSPTHPFELKLYGRDETRFIRVDKPGVIALGCNIHDFMVGFILVVDTPFAAKTDAAGQAVIHDVPAGPTTIRLWHPYLRAAGNAEQQAAMAPRDGTLRVTMIADLRPPPEPHKM